MLVPARQTSRGPLAKLRKQRITAKPKMHWQFLRIPQGIVHKRARKGANSPHPEAISPGYLRDLKRELHIA
jgi:hypothetical protein